MTQKISLFDKVTNFIFGESAPALTEADLQLMRELHQKLDGLSTVLKAGETKPEQPTNGQYQALAQSETNLSQTDQTELTEQVRKLAKTQFKANTLQESQLAQHQEALESLQKSINQQEQLVQELAKQREQAIEAARLDLLQSLLPVLDSLDAAFGSGRRQVLRPSMGPDVRQAIIAWLDGIRLARMRLLDLLASHDIQPIPTVGQSFDPHYHIAVAIDTTRQSPDGTIVSEDRSGYASPTRILREAKVVVARSK